MFGRLAAIVGIFICISLAWVALAATVFQRTHTQDDLLKAQVGRLWGSPQYQRAPDIYYETRRKVETTEVRNDEEKTVTKYEVDRNFVPLESSRVAVDLTLDHRRKGLIWYATYGVDYTATYTMINPTSEARTMQFVFSFPLDGAIYDDFRMSVGGTAMDTIPMTSGQVSAPIFLRPGEAETVQVHYRSRGLDEWWYAFGGSVNQIKNFSLTMHTDFDKIDFPDNSISPTEKQPAGTGWELTWTYRNLLAGVDIGMAMPQRLNPGPWVGQLTYAAPVSLFLFFFLLFVFTTIRGLNVHPMNYFFIGAAFFSFHLLLAYLVDHVSIHLAFGICSAVSVFLVASYMRLVVGARYAYREIAAAQFVYLVLFSYTFFFEGYTGLAITLLCVVTLFIVMQATGRMDWESVFRGEPQKPKGKGGNFEYA